MRKILTLLLVLMAVVVTGCTDDDKELPIVVASIFPQYDVVRFLAGNHVDLKMAVLPGVDTHNYDPSVEDIITIKKSDLFIYTGDFMENWASDIGASNSLNLSTISGIELSNIEDKHNHHEHNYDIDPHIWTSPKHLKLIVSAISSKLQDILPDYEAEIKLNETKYLEELDQIIVSMEVISANAINKTFYFGTPFAFHYLFKDFNLTYESVYDTCSTEVDPSMDDIIQMTEKIKNFNVPVIYVKELTTSSVAESIVLGTDCQIQLLHSGHNLAKNDFESGVTLLSIMKSNVDALRKALV